MNDGLEGVVAAQTVLSHADGEHGTVWVRGHPIAELVARHGYEGTVALMWDGFAGHGLDRARVVDELGAGRALAFSRLGDWLAGATRRPPIEGLRMALAALPDDARRRRSPRPCRSPSRRCCAPATARRRCRPIRRSPPPPISCA